MAGSLKPLEELGRHVATVLDDAAAARAGALDEARSRFLQGSGAPLARRSRFAWYGAAFAGVLLGAAAAVFFGLHHAPLTFEVNGAAGVPQAWLAAPPSKPMRLHFSEGSEVRLEPESKLRIVELDHAGASLSLESGHVHCEIVHRAGTAWSVVAGPFTVRVTGTVFDVNWDPNREQLTVSVAQGSVAVRGAALDSERVVHASETLRAATPNAEPSSSSLSASAPPSAVPDTAAANAANAANAPSASSSDEPSAPPTSTKDKDKDKDEPTSAWRAFAKRGALREAFASADAAGFSAICAGASPSELLMLGDGARLSGKPDRATEALLTLRRRFPADARRSAAAFALGKVAFDQRRAYEQAAEWFATSLREQPSGPLAREAEGRLIEALRAADDSVGARRAARDYLTRYPEGPHADLARSVLH